LLRWVGLDLYERQRCCGGVEGVVAAGRGEGLELVSISLAIKLIGVDLI
jgi:hypothetical protein